MPNTLLDVITIGRASVDLYGQQIGTRLEDVGSFAKSVTSAPIPPAMQLSASSAARSAAASSSSPTSPSSSSRPAA